MKFFEEAVIKLIRSQAWESEKRGVLTDDILSLIYQEKLFKIFIPQQLNGRELALPEALQLEIEAAHIDGNFGWSVMIGSGGGYFAGFIPPNLNEQLFSGEKAVVAGSGQPSATADKKDNGFVVNGQWKYCSGANYATLFTANCHIKEGGKEDKIKSFIFLPEQVNIIPDWKAYGMKATCSHSIKVGNVFVPEIMTFDISKPHHHYDYGVYQFPFLEFAQLTTLTTVIGCCRHFLEEAANIADQHKESWEAAHPGRYLNFIKTLNSKQNKLKEAVKEYYQLADTSWGELIQTGDIGKSLLVAIQTHCPNLRNIAVEASEAVYSLIGMSAVMEEDDINRAWRDLHTASQHMLLNDYKAK